MIGHSSGVRDHSQNVNQAHQNLISHKYRNAALGIGAVLSADMIATRISKRTMAKNISRWKKLGWI